MRRAQRLADVLGEYYALNEITLDSLDRLAGKHGLSVKELFDLIRENVSPSRWAIRARLACGQSALTSSPSDRYCSTCKSTVRKRGGKWTRQFCTIESALLLRFCVVDFLMLFSTPTPKQARIA